MKTLVPLVLLICFLGHISAAPVALSVQRDGCCRGYNRNPIPKGKVAHVGMTPSDCRSKSIIITTVCKKEFCVDPDWDWAKKLLEDFKKPASTTAETKCSKKM
ncbi:C-C motif chemokine 22-like [Anarrhichthys ocellatus]|uniref:C-C motif chemokine 22-like n=1 Tax=Anarrhichthys ocellatus TaxID=433405 RepID=UPI0012EDF6C5|nr:C-C motif chemokine 22-like [Anarrhichthys ocellatus]